MHTLHRGGDARAGGQRTARAVARHGGCAAVGSGSRCGGRGKRRLRRSRKRVAAHAAATPVTLCCTASEHAHGSGSGERLRSAPVPFCSKRAALPAPFTPPRGARGAACAAAARARSTAWGRRSPAEARCACAAAPGASGGGMEDAAADRALLRDWARAAEECRRVPPAVRPCASCALWLRVPHRATALAPQQPACARAGAQHVIVASRRGPHLTRLCPAPHLLAPSSAQPVGQRRARVAHGAGRVARRCGRRRRGTAHAGAPRLRSVCGAGLHATPGDTALLGANTARCARSRQALAAAEDVAESVAGLAPRTRAARHARLRALLSGARHKRRPRSGPSA
jgi:hypothetical protein